MKETPLCTINPNYERSIFSHDRRECCEEKEIEKDIEKDIDKPRELFVSMLNSV